MPPTDDLDSDWVADADGDRPHGAVLTYEYDDPGAARLVATSLRQDVGEIDDARSRATVERDGATVRVRVRAADLTALRAALNTWGSLVAVAERTRAVAGGRGSGGSSP